MRGISEVVKHLLIINVLFWVGTLIVDASHANMFTNLFAFHFPYHEHFKPWQLITHMFMHASYVPKPSGESTIYFQHILFNMFGLWMFGSPIENYLGSKRFVFFYISAGLGALLVYAGWDYINFSGLLVRLDAFGMPKEEALAVFRDETFNKLPLSVASEEEYIQYIQRFYGTMLGASGALMGVLAGYAIVYPNSELFLIFLPIPIKAKYFIPGIVALDVFSAFTGVSIFSPSNTAYLAHIGGALFGGMMMWYWKNNSFNKNRWY